MKALKEKLCSIEVIPRDLIALHGSGLSAPDSGIANRNKIILEEASKTLKGPKLVGISCLGNEDEVMNRLVDMELRERDHFEKQHIEVEL